MSKVVVSRICDCFLKSELEANSEFDSSEESLEHGLRLKDHMNDKFCSKHKFQLIKIFDDYTISTVDSKDKSLKCCGGTCCFTRS